MSDSLTVPQLRKAIAELARRIGILERRVIPQPAGTGNSGHDGSGTDSVLVAPTGDATADASLSYAIAVGADTEASGSGAIAIGVSAVASNTGSVAVGMNTTSTDSATVAIGNGADATAGNGVAIGNNATAGHGSVALGSGVSTTAANQVNIGTNRAMIGTPNSAAADADLVNSQVTFYLNQAGNTLVVKAKYSDGTVKTGTVALS